MDQVNDFRDLFEHAPCGYLLLNDRGRIVLTNATLREWLDVEDEELLGKRLLDLLPVAGRVFYETHFAPLLRMQGFFHEVALDFVRRDGTKLAVLANATQRADAQGEVLETRIALFQATSRRKYQRELYQAQQEAIAARHELEAVNHTLTETGKLREEFMAILGHDLRNPLASIGSGMRILSKENLSSKGERVIGLIDGSVARMSKLIDDVLDFARVRMGGGLAVSRKTEDELHLHLEQVVAELTSASGRQIKSVIDLSEPMFVDAGRIGQLVSNLLGNALSHGAQDQPVELSARMDEKALVIAVSNGGYPIPPETIDRLFQPFFRGGSTTGMHGQGLGLGLHIAAQIAKAHGGTLSVSSSDEKITFQFTMPVRMNN